MAPCRGPSVTAAELLAGLQDIRPPAEPGSWPLAPGLYVLLAVVALAAWAVWRCVARRRAGRPYQHAKRELRAARRGTRRAPSSAAHGLPPLYPPERTAARGTR